MKPRGRSTVRVAVVIGAAVVGLATPHAAAATTAPGAASATAAGASTSVAADAQPQRTTAAAAQEPTAPLGPAGDAFYDPPNPLPPGKPGDVIWQRTAQRTSVATTYLILYRSTTALGAPVAVSGTVTVPRGRNLAKAPVVGVTPPTAGLGDQCAVSKGNVTSVSAPYELLAGGIALATTDYEGLGTPGVHTYAVGLSQGRAVIDVVRAATRLGVGLSASSPVGFWGYSQGGGAAAWAGELASSYGSELPVKGIAAGGIPADLPTVGRELDGGIAFGFLAATAVGLDSAYPELDLERYLNDEGRKVLGAGQNDCLADVVFRFGFRRLAEFTTSNPLLSPQWQRRLVENSLGRTPPQAPIFMYHGTIDEVLGFRQAEALRRAYCQAGVNVTWRPQFGEHVSVVLIGKPEALLYLRDRLAGKSARSNC